MAVRRDARAQRETRRLVLITREVDKSKSKGDASALVAPTTRGAGFLLRPVVFDDARVREALSSLDVALLELVIGYQRAHGRPDEHGEVGGVTVPLATFATDRHVRAKVGRVLTERQVRASLERLRRYGLERVVRQRYVLAHTDAATTVRVTVREALPGVDVPDDAPAVRVPWSQLAHDEATRDLARPGRGRKGIARPEWTGPTTRTDGGTWAPCVAAPASPNVTAPARAGAPNVAAPVTMRRGSSASEARSEQGRAVRSGSPYVAAPYLLSLRENDSLSEDGETRGARRFSPSEAKHPDPFCPTCFETCDGPCTRDPLSTVEVGPVVPVGATVPRGTPTAHGKRTPGPTPTADAPRSSVRVAAPATTDVRPSPAASSTGLGPGELAPRLPPSRGNAKDATSARTEKR